MNVRQAVTGQDVNGKSVFVSDEEVEPITVQFFPGMKFYWLWDADETPKLPTGGRPLTQGRFPPAGGFRWMICSLSAEIGGTTSTPRRPGTPQRSSRKASRCT